MLKQWEQSEHEKWNERVEQNPDGGLLQSWEWGEFHEALGNAVYNLSNEEETIFAQCFQLKAGNQWILSIPRGPVAMPVGTGLDLSLQAWIQFLFHLKKFAQERGCFLVRFDPAISSGTSPSPFITPPPAKEGLGEVLQLGGGLAIKSHKELQPVHTLILDTSPSEEELLSRMKSKWRYNIRLAEKKGVTMRWSKDPADAKLFAELMRQTTDRQDFTSYDEEYFSKLMEALGKEEKAAFLFAEYEGKTIAGLLLGFSGTMASYLHGASDHSYRHLMAPHLLQWEAIKEAKKRGMHYDFWGVAADPPANKQEENWKGVTRFKKGFAPKTEITEYMGTYEIPVKNFLYLLYRLRQLVRV